MPAKESYSTVLVNGANSFFAAAIMDKLTEIHGAVRTERAAQPLKDRYGTSIDVLIVPDITVPDAFRQAKNCDAVIHVASPFRHEFKDARTDMLDLAIKGALSALAAANH